MDDDASITLSPSTAERARRAAGPRTSLLVFYGESAEVVPLEENDSVVIGRSHPSDVVVSDRNLSRQHARFTHAREGVWAEDLGSTNGTELRGERIGRALLRPGDAVALGRVTVSVHRTAADAAVTLGVERYDRFLERVEDELVRGRTFLRRVALLMLRAEGDATERHVGSWIPRIREHLRPVDRVALYGPNAALVLLLETDRERATAVARAMAAASPVLSIGVALDGTTAEELIDTARSLARTVCGGVRIESHEAPTSTSAPLLVSAKMIALAELVERVARATIPVLIRGETGVGKEVIARMIHSSGPRRHGPMRTVNCGALPANLLESVLFGHEKGAFTGADRATEGLFEQAQGGTLFLDEVGELSPAAQVALLRVLESRTIVRVGGAKEMPVDVRVIAATNRDLDAMVREGAFRSDLLFRVDPMTLHVPPLRERPEDIDPLLDRFLGSAARQMGSPARTIDDEARELIRRYSWPGNVRELRNVVERAVVVCVRDRIGVADLPDKLHGRIVPAATPSFAGHEREDAEFKDRMREYETQLILDALRRCRGNQSEAAKLLRMPIRTLTYKIKAYGIKKQFELE